MADEMGKPMLDYATYATMMEVSLITWDFVSCNPAMS